MVLADTLHLCRRGEQIYSFPLGPHVVEVGSHPGCDIGVHASGVPPRALLVQPGGGTVYVYDLARAPGLGAPSVMPLDEAIPIGGGYSITRAKASTEAPTRVRTELLEALPCELRSLAFVRGAGAQAHAVRIEGRPLSVGSAPDNGMSLSDRAVSRYHCRIEPSARGIFIRDLGSTNGTWVDGVRVHRLELRAGAVVRLGRTELRVARRTPTAEAADADPVVQSSAMLAVMADVDRFARLPWPVLICGETGVGKEVVARALHDRGPQRNGPFIAVNGGGLPGDLIESELFGHERGAFTGAVQAHRGAFEQAHGGTLFLDEIGELPPALQTRLLRVLETWQVRRVGSESSRRVEVRLVCATHRDLRAMAQEGRFRSDLYYRIHRLVVEVPALRQRPADIAPLARHFLGAMCQEVGEKALSEAAVLRLRAYRWPGNVRELRNVLELAAVGCDASSIDGGTVDRVLRRIAGPSAARPTAGALRETLEHYGGNLSAAARALGMPRSTLRDRLSCEPEPEG